ncbi:MAG TPA: hypothetical protein VFK18_01950 [Luteimonas sp.]|nr:hypothetical protein [Luteimonas sp.]
MADTPRPWAILQATQARLQTIATAAGFRTDLGADVRLDKQEFLAGDPDRIILYAGSTVRPEDARTRAERGFDLIAEIYVSTSHADAQERIVAAAEDVEDVLETFLPLPDALPLSFEECAFLDGPDGVEAWVAQIMFSTRFRRGRA